MEENKIIIYQTEDWQTQIDVRLENETVWLNTNQMALLFEREDSNIRRHIINVFKDGELEKDNNVHFLHVNGIKKPVPFYNLDVIISVGYRVNTKRGIKFRQWANKVLKESGDGSLKWPRKVGHNWKVHFIPCHNNLCTFVANYTINPHLWCTQDIGLIRKWSKNRPGDPCTSSFKWYKSTNSIEINTHHMEKNSCKALAFYWFLNEIAIKTEERPCFTVIIE